MDDGRAKQPLPMVVQICTTMASNRQSYPYKIKVKKESFRINPKNERSEFLDERSSSLQEIPDVINEQLRD